jgi:hypothetical protein
VPRVFGEVAQIAATAGEHERAVAFFQAAELTTRQVRKAQSRAESLVDVARCAMAAGYWELAKTVFRSFRLSESVVG